MPDRQTTEDRATQLLYSIQFKLSHAMLPKILCVSQQECYNSNLPYNGHRDREWTKTLVAKHVNVGVICDIFYGIFP